MKKRCMASASGLKCHPTYLLLVHKCKAVGVLCRLQPSKTYTYLIRSSSKLGTSQFEENGWSGYERPYFSKIP